MAESAYVGRGRFRLSSRTRRRAASATASPRVFASSLRRTPGIDDPVLKACQITPPFGVIVAWPRRRRVGRSAYPGSAVPARTWQLPLVPNHDHFPSHARARSDPGGSIHPFDAAILMAPGRVPTSPPPTRSSRGGPPPRGDRNDGGLSGPGIRRLRPRLPLARMRARAGSRLVL